MSWIIGEAKLSAGSVFILSLRAGSGWERFRAGDQDRTSFFLFWSSPPLAPSGVTWEWQTALRQKASGNPASPPSTVRGGTAGGAQTAALMIR